MNRAYTIMWTAAFMALLVINLAIVATSRLHEPDGNGDFTDDYALLDAPDEVRLGWWPAEGDMPGPGATGEGVSRANPVVIDSREIETPGGRAFKDYPSLMAEYIKRVNGYLVKYYHIMSETAPSLEDRG